MIQITVISVYFFESSIISKPRRSSTAFLTPATGILKLKHTTEAKNSRKKLNLKEARSSYWEKLKKKPNFTNFLKYEICLSLAK